MKESNHGMISADCFSLTRRRTLESKLHLRCMPTGNKGASLHSCTHQSWAQKYRHSRWSPGGIYYSISPLLDRGERKREFSMVVVTLANSWEPAPGIFDSKAQAFSNTLYSHPIIPSPSLFVIPVFWYSGILRHSLYMVTKGNKLHNDGVHKSLLIIFRLSGATRYWVQQFLSSRTLGKHCHVNPKSLEVPLGATWCHRVLYNRIFHYR